MIIRRFLKFIRTASAAERAAGANALGRAYLVSPLAEDERAAAEAALTVLLDDSSPQVRQGLAEALGASHAAPRHVILALAEDQIEVASAVLRRSPLLLDAELVDHVARADPRVQRAVAERRPLSAPVAAALAEVGDAAACAAMLENDTADLPVFSLARMAERHGEDAVVRDLLLARADLPTALRRRLVSDLGAVLGAFVAARGWLAAERAEATTREALDRATLTIASEPGRRDLAEFVTDLAQTRQLTPALLLRALCCGHRVFFEEALTHLTGLSRARVAAVVADGAPQTFRAVYRRAGLPDSAYPAFQSALEVIAATEVPDRPGGEFHHSRQVLERVLTRYRAFSPDESDHLLLLLRRFASEAAREEARHFASAYVDDEVLLIEGPKAA